MDHNKNLQVTLVKRRTQYQKKSILTAYCQEILAPNRKIISFRLTTPLVLQMDTDLLQKAHNINSLILLINQAGIIWKKLSWLTIVNKEGRNRIL